MLAIDLQISQYFFTLGRSLPGALVQFLATDFFWVLLAWVLFLSCLAGPAKAGRWRLWAQAVAAALSALAINVVIGWLYWRHRPFVDLLFAPLVNVAATTKSFPSDHAGTAWALAGTVWLTNKRSGSIALLVALLIAVARVLAGVHYFSDIAAGAGIGLAVAWVFNRYARRDRNLFNSLMRRLDKF